MAQEIRAADKTTRYMANKVIRSLADQSQVFYKSDLKGAYIYNPVGHLQLTYFAIQDRL